MLSDETTTQEGGGHMKPTTSDTYLAAIARLEARKENQRLKEKLRRIQAIIDE